MVYAAAYRSLAMLEVLAHLQDEDEMESYSFVPIRFDESLIEVLPLESLPNYWTVDPPSLDTQSIGDTWITSRRSLVLSVPSVIIPQERNYLINPIHPALSQVTVGLPHSCQFDSRLR